MAEKLENVIKKLKEENECCPNCTSIEKCRVYNENGKARFPDNYKWTEACCERCNDMACFQNPFYVLSLSRNKKEKDLNILADYQSEALSTILSF